MKTRNTGDFGVAAEAVTPMKQRRLASMATDYLVRRRLTNQPCRFDVVAIEDMAATPRVTVYRSAFTL